jgi:sec-independent protein translocase protein TatA
MNTLALIPLFFANIRGWQLIIILLVILLLFGGKKIPELMRGLGKGVNSFKQGLQEAKEELEKPVEKDTKKSKDDSDAE